MIIQYFIERDGFVIAQGACDESQLPNVNLMGGKLVFETTLPKAGPSASILVLIQRQELLQQSDWTQIPNNPLTVEKQEAWADYRQQLRDITLQPGYPNNVIWPTPPQG